MPELWRNHYVSLFCSFSDVLIDPNFSVFLCHFNNDLFEWISPLIDILSTICHWLICMDTSCHGGGFGFELYPVLPVPIVFKNHSCPSLPALKNMRPYILICLKICWCSHLLFYGLKLESCKTNLMHTSQNSYMNAWNETLMKIKCIFKEDKNHWSWKYNLYFRLNITEVVLSRLQGDCCLQLWSLCHTTSAFEEIARKCWKAEDLTIIPKCFFCCSWVGEHRHCWFGGSLWWCRQDCARTGTLV